MLVIRWHLLVIVGVWLVAAAPTGAQAPVDPGLVRQFIAAPDAERASLLARVPEIGERPFRIALLELGQREARAGELDASEQTFRAVLWLGDQAQSQAVRGLALANLTRVYGERGDLGQAGILAAQALAIAEQQNDISGTHSALVNLGIVQRRIGDRDAALTSFDRALTLARQLGLDDAVARVLNNIGLVHNDFGNYALAHDYLNRSLALKMNADDGGRGTQDIARTVGNIGIVFAEQGDYPRAIHQYEQAAAMFERSGGGPSLTNTISNIGQAYLSMGLDERARTYFERALPQAEAAGDLAKVATLYYLFGNLSRNAHRYEEAEAYHRRSLALREPAGETIGLAESYTELANLALLRHELEQAVPLARRAVAIATAGRLPSQLWNAQQVLAQIQAALGQEQAAIAMYNASIGTIEAMRRQTTGGDRARQVYLGERLAPYYGLARLHAAAGRGLEAFAVVESARARTLLDILAGSRQPTRLMSQDERDRDRQLQQAVASLAAQVDAEVSRSKPDVERLSVLDGQLVRARLDRDAFLSALYDAKPDLRLARGEAPVVTRDELAALVPRGTAIVSFLLEEQHAWAYLITAGPNGPVVKAKQLSIGGAALAKAATQFAEQVGARDQGFAPVARSLYDALFVSSGIDQALAGISNLIIIPDDTLWRVPFQALRTPRGVFVIEERTVSYAHSVSALASLSRRRQGRPARAPFLLALGDPIGAPTPPSSTAGSRGRPQRLPEAAREVRALGRLYGTDNSTVLVAADATEPALRAQLPTATVVHVATHGIFDDRSPMYSHLRLGEGVGGDSASDGRLEAWEVMDLKIDADLAVLSACETARGTMGHGEGVLGLSWSLFAAGASTAVVSLWEVDSASTTELMIAFHERLLAAPSAAGGARRAAPQALRDAARRVMKAPAYRHPFYWAAFVSVGAP